MELENASTAIDFEARLRRSHGRTGRTYAATAKVTRDELTVLEAAAKTSGKALSEWSRDTLLREARRSKDDALMTELVAVRMLMVQLLKPIMLGQKVSVEMIAEIMAMVKREKHRTTREVMEQYTAAQPQEPR